MHAEVQAMGLLSRRELDVTVDHCRFGLLDMAAAATVSPPHPAAGAGWVAAGPCVIYIETTDDVLRARLSLEVWDGPAAINAAHWPDYEHVRLDLPSGRFGVDEIAAGWEPDVFALPSAGRWQVRIARREGAVWLPVTAPTGYAPTEDPSEKDVGAYYLLQFWPAVAGPDSV
ncbi:hypothetical protein AB0F77_20560 [Streptomyces sp. NPDC026672]|uniref:hypothetical protein n=1 Tax=unclassified Streptomyces TaxID=2593676 RepID=UPI0033D24337